MKRTQATEPTPAYSIDLYIHPGNYWTGSFRKDGVEIFNTGIPNSFAYVFARLEPWFAQAPNTVVPK